MLWYYAESYYSECRILFTIMLNVILLSVVAPHKQLVRLERLATDKHSSLLQKFINCGQKSFITIY
jgi:hypothetical protein